MSQSEPEQPVELLTLPSAAKRVGVGLRQLRRARDHGELKTYRIGGWNRVRWQDVLNWLEGCRQDPESPVAVQAFRGRK